MSFTSSPLWAFTVCATQVGCHVFADYFSRVPSVYSTHGVVSSFETRCMHFLARYCSRASVHLSCGTAPIHVCSDILISCVDSQNMHKWYRAYTSQHIHKPWMNRHLGSVNIHHHKNVPNTPLFVFIFLQTTTLLACLLSNQYVVRFWPEMSAEARTLVCVIVMHFPCFTMLES